MIDLWIDDLFFSQFTAADKPNYVAILVNDSTGQRYKHQCGGLANRHVELIGKFWDCPMSAELRDYCGRLETAGDQIIIFDMFIPYLQQLGWEVDRTRESYEALIAIKRGTLTGWLVWENSD